MKSIWSDDSDFSSSDKEQHVTNMRFKTIKSKNKVQSLDDESNPTYNELHYAFKSLYDEFKKVKFKL